MKLIYLIILLFIGCAEMPVEAPKPSVPLPEPFAIEQGCASIGSCALTNNRNKFDSSKQKTSVTCSGSPCPQGMSRVCSSKYKVNLCVDVELVSKDLVPEGNYSYPKCQAECASQGKRVLTNNEWLVAMNGTRADKCKASGPRNRTKGSPTQDAPDYNSSSDMKNLSFNKAGFRQDRADCISNYGIKDGVSVLGQWVSDGYGSSKPQFNGGLWAFPSASTLFYRTNAHGESYYDYSIGCRCGS